MRTPISRRTALLAAGLLMGFSSGIRAAAGRTFDSAGVSIHYIEEGRGVPVVLLHGYTTDLGEQWVKSGVMQALAAQHRVVALDARGHGLSGKPHDRAAYGREMGLDIVRLLDHLGIERAHVVGYSMGGAVAQLLARDHRDVVRGIVLCATAADWSDPRMKALWSAMGGVRLLLGLAPATFWRRMLRALGSEDDAATTWHASELARGSAVDLAEAGRELGRGPSRRRRAAYGRDLPAGRRAERAQ